MTAHCATCNCPDDQRPPAAGQQQHLGAQTSPRRGRGGNQGGEGQAQEAGRGDDVKIGDQVIDGNGDLWTVLNAPCDIPGAESQGFFRRVTPKAKRGGQQYGEHIPGPLVVWEMPR